ncbi:rRNA maturation RNase YbeY [Acetobacter fallax]|uniref:Endoribonuclease YbeY n=1 Tax=Acetobacter fallax TaxID=1737473 RepID=A0ABX0K5W7_9PROT|nr:rRNA maturation RNase YbeY [Acetobacter fallax]NHO31699.1 rRNA maturation RNase YbeY [Acetobacter fallax]NHO35258.1 rRNA maturation RNase YbeY [Acetobacter fallax]
MEPPGSIGRGLAAATESDPSRWNGSLPSPLFDGEGDFEPDDDGPEIIVEERRWRAFIPRAEAFAWRACAAACLHAEAPVPETIVLSSDRVVKRLNARHRGRNKPTNVLTFEPPAGFPGGEIILALETVCREARAARRPVADHLMHLVVHGVLHLDGHDHHGAGEARRMEMEEARVLSTIGVPNPWKPRT